METGQKHTFILIENDFVYFKTDNLGVLISICGFFSHFSSKCTSGWTATSEKTQIGEMMHLCGV